MGRWLVVAQNLAKYLFYWVLTDSADPIAQKTVQPLTDEELQMREIWWQIVELIEAININIGDDVMNEESKPILTYIYYK